MAQHSVTEEFDQSEKQMEETMKALDKLGHQTIIVLNNSDAGSSALRRVITHHKKPFMHVVPNMTRQDYVGLMNVADVIVGNSSSGILEAPTFKLPAVNIGNRQRDRMQSTNVINVEHNKDKIVKAVKKAMTPAFKKKVSKCINPYGDGKSAKRIVKILESIPSDDKLLVKRITY